MNICEYPNDRHDAHDHSVCVDASLEAWKEDHERFILIVRYHVGGNERTQYINEDEAMRIAQVKSKYHNVESVDIERITVG